MAQLQYIGARYIPIWYQNSVDQTANWEINVEYEPLTWVTSQNNHLYLSKKTVPDNIGTPAQNTEYWLDMGVITGNVQEIQDQIDAIVANIGDLSDLETTDKSSIVNAINEIAGASPTPTANERKFLFLGDSYYLGSASAVMTGHGWADFVIQYLGLDSDHYIKATLSDICGDPVVVATPGFSASAGSHRSFKTILESVYNRIGSDVAQTVTDIVVAGGYNDIDKSDIPEGIEDYATYAHTNFPKAKLWLAEIGNDGGNTRAAQRKKLYTLITPIYEYESVKNHMSYISHAERVLVNPTMFESGSPAHPTVAGYQRIGASIANALVGGGVIFPYVSEYSLATHAGSGWTLYQGEIKAEAVRYGIKRIYASADVVFTPLQPQTVSTFGQIGIPIDFDGIMPTNIINRPVNVIFGNAGGYMVDSQTCELSFGYSSTYQLLFILTLHNRTAINDYTSIKIEKFDFDYNTVDL